MIAKEGFIFIAVPAVLGILLLVTGTGPIAITCGYIFAALTFFCVYFFRDPKRTAPEGENLVVSPCDGTVMETGMESGEQVIRVFLSVFNVHIQRSPVAGLVKKVEYRPGKFLPANKPQAHVVNEQNVFTIETNKGVVIVKQIAGILARRVVAWSKAGDNLKRGDKIGLIKFGSQVDIHLPASAEVKVKPGDKITGAETIIGE